MEESNRPLLRDGPQFLSTVPATSQDRRAALAVIIVSLLIFIALAPFAQTPLKPVWAFIPIYETVLVLNDLFTALLLYGQFSNLRERPLAVLASGYLFTCLMAAFHALSFPGLFTPAGLLGAGTQSTVWLYMFWHTGFPLFVIAYTLLKGRRTSTLPDARSCSRFIALCIASTVFLAGGLTILTTAGHDLLPVLLGKYGYTTVMRFVTTVVWATSLAAFIVLLRHRLSSVLELWLMVVVFAWLIDVALSTQINAGRFDLGFYSGRIYGAVAASLILAILLLENTGLYAQLGTTHSRLAEQNRELQSEVAVRREAEKALRCAESDLREHRDQLEELVAERTAALGEVNRLLADDIQVRQRVERALMAEKQRAQITLRSIADAVITADSAGRIKSANPAACSLFGYAEHDLLTMRLKDLCNTEDSRLDVVLARWKEDGEVFSEIAFMRNGREVFEARVALKKFDDEMGQPMTSMVIQDITERRRMEEELRRSEQKFRLLYENAPIGIAHISLGGHWTYVNRKFAEIAGYAPEELVGLSYLDVTPVDERAINTEITEKLLDGAIEVHREERVLRRDGSTSWIRLTARMLRDDSGNPQYGISIFEDINERKKAESALRDSEERFRATFENAPLGIAEAALDGVFIKANPKLLETLGYTLEEFKRLSALDITHPADIEQTLCNFQMLVSGKTSSNVLEKRNIRKDGSFVWMNVTTALRYVDGVPKYIIGVFEDVSARRIAEENLRRALEHSHHLANHDALTGLANRAKFNDRLKDALSYASRDGHLVAIHLLDLDRFKAINDTHGHHIGDLLLQEVASRIKAQTRATDIVARLGGDEFAIIQTYLADSFAAGVLAEKIVNELGRIFVLERQDINSGASIGIALYPDDAEDPEQLVTLADLALYEAKNCGRSNFQFYQHEMGAAVEDARQLGQELRNALSEGQFFLHYQPQFDLRSGRISGLEALIRWRHPEKGLLAAAKFIQDAENAGLMSSIGEWTLRAACSQHKKWMDAGLDVPLILNVSLRQLRHLHFPQTLKNILEETGLSPSALQLDARESVLWDSKFSPNLLKEVKSIGVRLSLDDYGAELVALSSLQRFPLDVVKPGRCLVKELPHREQEASLLAAVISAAHKMKIEVCAEGVETADQLAAVKARGCDAAQGFLLSSPLSELEVDRLVEAEISHS